MPSSEKSVIVIVDQDEAVLTSLHSFFSLESDYNIFVFTKPKEALDFIQTNATDVVVTEHYWLDLKGRPIGEGLPFLSKVKAISPHTTRIILATIVDKEMIIHAINDVGVFQIIEKPWDNDKLRIVIEKGLMKSKKSKDLVERTRKEITETSRYRPSGRGRVVVVDDDEITLTSIKSMFDLKADYDIKTFTRPKEALIYLRNNEVDIIIADYLMPEMDGISFLAEVKKMAPHYPGILLTGYADRENAQRAVNELGLYHCIEKPWDNEDLCIVVRNGIEKKRLFETLYKKKEHKKELVFIAYAREDKEFALGLAKILKDE
ncbi:MAG: response regulator [Verrucomicrobia bacterium]|nr:response regulator [Verrucomicrobiota bacterium]